MRLPYLLCITLIWLSHPQLRAQAFTNAVTPEPDPQQEQVSHIAVPVEQLPSGQAVRIEARQQSKEGDTYTLEGDVTVHAGDYTLHSQKLVYHRDTGIAESPGEFTLEGGEDAEHIRAAHGEVNVRENTAHLYDVTGTIVATQRGAHAEHGSPFLFRGEEVLKQGPQKYVIYRGFVTSCELPHPDWEFSVRRATLDGEQAKISQSIFRLVQVPIFYLPYASISTGGEGGRKTGILIPTVGTSSSKGFIIGEEFFWAIDRSSDLTVGLDYYSTRGWAERAVYRYRGPGLDFVRGSFSALQDRGLPISGPFVTPPSCLNSDATATLKCDQGGEDIVAAGRYDLDPHTRVAGNIEYLSSYIYRQAFAESFALAVNSEVKSSAYLTHDWDNYVTSLLVERYQNFESTTIGDEIRILHTPALEFNVLDRSLGKGFFWHAESSADAMRRSEPGFSTGGLTERVDLHPTLGWQGFFEGLSVRPWMTAHETFYSRSQQPGSNTPSGYVLPVERAASINRAAFETGADIQAPAVERDFHAGGWDWRHVIEPGVSYRYVTGVDDFQQIIRFDNVDLLSDTNELRYGLTQRLYVRHPRRKPCKPTDVQCTPQLQEAFSWKVEQKYYFNPDFGGAITTGQRNVLDSTIDLTGAAFLTRPRDQSPVVSRFLWRSSSNVDVEWDADYDTRRGQLLQSNLFANYRRDGWFAGLGNAHLIEPGEVPRAAPTSAPLDFNQIRLLAGYGGPSKSGLSLAANAGYDFNQEALQYGAVQTSYNWNCCGLSVEYRRFALGSVRNENSYRFNLTLAGIGTAGNLRRAERLY